MDDFEILDESQVEACIAEYALMGITGLVSELSTLVKFRYKNPIKFKLCTEELKKRNMYEYAVGRIIL